MRYLIYQKSSQLVDDFERLFRYILFHFICSKRKKEEKRKTLESEKESGRIGSFYFILLYTYYLLIFISAW